MPSSRPHRVGILLDGFAAFAGTADFLVSIVDAMERTKGERELVLISQSTPKWYAPQNIARWAKYAARAVLSGNPPLSLYEHPDPSVVVNQLETSGMPRLRLVVVPFGERALARACAREGLDALIPSLRPLSRGFPVPWVGYIYDFQHRALPGNFTADVARARDRNFTAMLRNAPIVICNARAVKHDAERFVDKFEAEIIALPFSSMPPPAWFDTDTLAARIKHGVGERYFMISNQFWIHKRHDLAFAAFAELAKEDPQIELVCSGSTEDWRAPEYFPGLIQMLHDAGIRDRVHVLGLVSKSEQIALMRGSLAVIQPTAFEGGPGGGSVFDAVALGVPTLVSDIPVNREIEQFVTAFFDLEDPASLVHAMHTSLACRSPAPDREGLLSAGLVRREAKGRALWHAIDRALSIWGGNENSQRKVP